MARAGVITLNAVDDTTQGTPVQSGRRQWVSWSYEPTGTVTGGVNLQFQVRLTETGLWFDVGPARTDIAGRFIVGNIPVPIYEARANQTGAITGGGTITATIMYG
jgi:hypothetical protein